MGSPLPKSSRSYTMYDPLVTSADDRIRRAAVRIRQAPDVRPTPPPAAGAPSVSGRARRCRPLAGRNFGGARFISRLSVPFMCLPLKLNFDAPTNSPKRREGRSLADASKQSTNKDRGSARKGRAPIGRTSALLPKKGRTSCMRLVTSAALSGRSPARSPLGALKFW